MTQHHLTKKTYKKGGVIMDWKTTLTGLVTAIATLLAHFNIMLSPDLQIFIVSAGVFLLGLFAKDASKTN